MIFIQAMASDKCSYKTIFASYLLKSVKHDLQQKMPEILEISFGHHDRTDFKKFCYFQTYSVNDRQMTEKKDVALKQH